MVCLSCTATGERVCLAAEGFGNRHCFLENIADKNVPPDLSQCTFVIEQALSVRALQELVTAAGSESVSGLWYGVDDGDRVDGGGRPVNTTELCACVCMYVRSLVCNNAIRLCVVLIVIPQEGDSLVSSEATVQPPTIACHTHTHTHT